MTKTMTMTKTNPKTIECQIGAEFNLHPNPSLRNQPPPYVLQFDFYLLRQPNMLIDNKHWRKMDDWINELENSCTLIDIASYKMSYNSETEQKASFMGRKIMVNEAKKGGQQKILDKKSKTNQK